MQAHRSDTACIFFLFLLVLSGFVITFASENKRNNMSRQLLDKLDREILKMISEDARVPFLEVARACGVSGAAIHQRIQKLTSLGILKGSQFIIDPEKIGERAMRELFEYRNKGYANSYVTADVKISRTQE